MLGGVQDFQNLGTREGFYPAIAIHSPYSVHPALIKKAIELAGLRDIRSAHTTWKVDAERTWLDNNDGDFKPFFRELLKQDYAVEYLKEFLERFKDTPTLFTRISACQRTGV